MGSFGDHYILASDRSGHDRLRMLCEIHDPHTRALLLKAGLNAKHRFVEWVSRSIYDHRLPENSFDYGYTRWILTHLSRPIEAMRRVFEALRPGGIFVCEEPDLSTYTRSLLRRPTCVVSNWSWQRQPNAGRTMRLGADCTHGHERLASKFWKWELISCII
jgi:SAM-dependent methyltransferase